ncbi:MAG: hypothetical protein OHK0015_25330 [Chloroflexi bacterium OHK40]
MGGFRFDWRWVALIAFVAILANASTLPWAVVALTLGVSGGYLLWLAWRAWGIGGGGRGDSRRVTYWRGQRIETAGPTRRYRPRTWEELAPIALYGLVGLALVLGAIAVLARNL